MRWASTGWRSQPLHRKTDKAILSRAHESMGRINAFLENPAEAMKSFDEAIRLGDVRGGAYREALEGKKKLGQPPD